MLELENYFNNENDFAGDPKLRLWEQHRNSPEVEEWKLELKRERNGLVFKPAKISMHFYGVDGGDLSGDLSDGQVDWDDDLNRALVKREVRAISKDNEKDRFALALRTALRKAENRFGDGYFNSVLIQFIKNSPFAKDPQVKDVLKDIRRPPLREGFTDSTDCTEMIDLAIRGRAKELIHDLRYKQPEAEEILSGAISLYLDERFSVTNRRMLDWT